MLSMPTAFGQVADTQVPSEARAVAFNGDDAADGRRYREFVSLSPAVLHLLLVVASHLSPDLLFGGGESSTDVVLRDFRAAAGAASTRISAGAELPRRR